MRSYVCYELSKDLKNELLRAYPPMNERVICDHVTIQYDVDDETYPKPITTLLNITGYVCVNGLEAFIVHVNGSKIRPDGKIYHITHSLNPSVFSSKDSHQFLLKANNIRPIVGIGYSKFNPIT